MNVTRYKCSILVVDDDRAVLNLLMHQLSGEFEVLAASSVREARTLLTQRSFDMVLTDLRLPDEPGLALLEWVYTTSPRTARILISGTARLEDAADAINQAQIHRLILKPWRGDDLLQILRGVARMLTMERSHEQLLDDLREGNQKLEQNVKERTRELEIALAEIQEKNHLLEKLALSDTLTRLPNRRAIEMTAVREIYRRSRMPSPLTLLMIDVDFFKQINTDHLHTGGDHVLIWVAGLLQSCIRALDALGRLAGEEFLVIAPNTDTTGATVLAERLRETVASSSTEYKGRKVRVTISLGVVVVEANGAACYEDLIVQASAALKEAKETGRNRSVIRSYVP
jgi:diguanylate cyclase (GGDEF)-like protein